jgi:hypothetical protein
MRFTIPTPHTYIYLKQYLYAENKSSPGRHTPTFGGGQQETPIWGVCVFPDFSMIGFLEAITCSLPCSPYGML